MSSTLSRSASGTVAGLSKGPYRAPRGTEISCRGWQQEAALRMLLNNLDPEVAEKPEDLVGLCNNWDRFHELDRAGLMMYGQMTAGSWIYIGTQGILQGTYETFAAAAKKHFGGNLAINHVVTGEMGSMGVSQPLAATMNGAAFLGIDVDPERIKR